MAQVKKIRTTEEIDNSVEKKENVNQKSISSEQIEKLKTGGVIKGQVGLDFEYKTKDEALKDMLKEHDIEPFNNPTIDASIKTSESYGTLPDLEKKVNDRVLTPAPEGLAGGPVKITPYKVRSVSKDETEDRAWGKHLNSMISVERLLKSLAATKMMHNAQSKGIIEAANTQMISNPVEVYDRITVTSGQPYFNAAKRTIDSLPPVNSDYLHYAARRQVGLDAANQLLTQGELSNSQEFSQKTEKNLQQKRAYLDMQRQVEAHNRQLQAQKIAALSQLRAGTIQSLYKSLDNAGYQFQAELDQDNQLAQAAGIAKQQSILQQTAEKEFEQYLVDTYMPAYNSDANKGTLSFKQWLATKPEFTADINAKKQEIFAKIDNGMLEYKHSLLKYPNLFPLQGLKTGGKIRSANDQIRINKHRSIDQNWVNSNKDVNKAVSQLNKQVYQILMKILSNEI